MLLHADASRVALREKGNENDKGRANVAPSSCQRIHLCGYDAQTGKVNGSGCQT